MVRGCLFLGKPVHLRDTHTSSLRPDGALSEIKVMSDFLLKLCPIWVFYLYHITNKWLPLLGPSTSQLERTRFRRCEDSQGSKNKK